MKFALILVFIMVSANAFAQQVPKEVTDKSTSVKKLPMPPPQVSGAGQQYNNLRDTLQIQANEIKTLSNKIDSLEQQMRRLEGRRRY